tara:strand:+ start:3079 stop:4218 length:1140 start_codon:yes stop_codon:yes gene_type:complete
MAEVKDGSQEIQKSTTENEKNTNNENGTEDKDNLDTQLTILVNGETVQISEDFTGTHVQNKDEGHGLHIQKNGDIIILSGSGGKGQACGGRMLINTKNGQITKSGPIIEEVNASSKNSGEDGSKTNKDSGNSEVAYSGSFSGDHEVEIQGTKYVKARDIVLDATDTITLRGTKVIVAVDEWVEEKGLVKSKVDTIEEEVTAQRTSEVKEDVSKQYDTRASKNTVGTGHINENVQGDYQMKVAGIYNLQIQGNSVAASPLIKNRSFGLNIGLNNAGITGGARLNAEGMIDISTNSKNIILNSGKGIGIDAYAVDDPPENGEVRISGSTAGVKMISWKGANEANSTLIEVKEDGIKAKTKQKVEVEATGDFKVTAAKIYLN